MVTVRYSGPARGAQMLAREIDDATGMRVDAAPPQERRGLGHDVVFVLMRVESDVEAGLIGAAALAAVQRVLKVFRERHPGVEVEAVEDERPTDAGDP